jgi:hypothetical protein
VLVAVLVVLVAVLVVLGAVLMAVFMALCRVRLRAHDVMVPAPPGPVEATRPSWPPVASVAAVPADRS